MEKKKGKRVVGEVHTYTRKDSSTGWSQVFSFYLLPTVILLLLVLSMSFFFLFTSISPLQWKDCSSFFSYVKILSLPGTCLLQESFPLLLFLSSLLIILTLARPTHHALKVFFFYRSFMSQHVRRKAWAWPVQISFRRRRIWTFLCLSHVILLKMFPT